MEGGGGVIKTDLESIRCQVVDWIELARNINQ
jgi:hypothetical protein